MSLSRSTNFLFTFEIIIAFLFVLLVILNGSTGETQKTFFFVVWLRVKVHTWMWINVLLLMMFFGVGEANIDNFISLTMCCKNLCVCFTYSSLYIYFCVRTYAPCSTSITQSFSCFFFVFIFFARLLSIFVSEVFFCR